MSEWTLLLILWRGLPLAHLERSMFTLSKQTKRPTYKILFDNNSGYSYDDLQFAVKDHTDLSDWTVYSCRYNTVGRALSWNHNRAFRLCDTETFIMTRADCLFHSSLFHRLLKSHSFGGPSFSTSWVWNMPYYSHEQDGFVNHADDLEPLRWRHGINRLCMNRAAYSRHIHTWRDTPAFCSDKKTVEMIGGYDERHFTCWGFDQQDFQGRLRNAGVQIRVIKRFLTFHMNHPADRDIDKALRQHGQACFDRTV